jgi:hypothetical protein
MEHIGYHKIGAEFGPACGDGIGQPAWHVCSSNSLEFGSLTVTAFNVCHLVPLDDRNMSICVWSIKDCPLYVKKDAAESYGFRPAGFIYKSGQEKKIYFGALKCKE